MNPRKLVPPAILLGAGLLCCAFTAGGTAYTKRMETALLASPSVTAKPVGKLGFGKSLTVQELKGSWVRVKESQLEGWVFQGNIAANDPKETAGIDIIPLSASATSSTAAARPLAEQASEYAERTGKAAARADVLWLEKEADQVTTTMVREYLEQEAKGEFTK